jgi:hypothetical protein
MSGSGGSTNKPVEWVSARSASVAASDAAATGASARTE